MRLRCCWFDLTTELEPLLPGDVRVFYFSLDPDNRFLARLQQTLSADELLRSARFRIQADQRRFIAHRGTARLILSYYLAVQPGELRFRYGPTGKPSFRLPGGAPDLRFNLSHSGDVGLLAVTVGQEIGVDVELLREFPDFLVIARRFFAAGESRTILSLPPPLRLEAFFTCWTRKEAYIKARGRGIGSALETFEVSVTPGEPATLLSDAHDPEAPLQWGLHEVALIPSYCAALAVERYPRDQVR